MPASILIVDRNAGNRILTRAALEEGHYRVRTTGTATEARELIALEAPDVVIVALDPRDDQVNDQVPAADDIYAVSAEPKTSDATAAMSEPANDTLPPIPAGRSELALIAELSGPGRAGGSLPVIALGRFESADLRLSALRAGAVMLAERPVSSALLQAQIRRILRRRDHLRELGTGSGGLHFVGVAEDAAAFRRRPRIAIMPLSSHAPAMCIVDDIEDALMVRIEPKDPEEILGVGNAHDKSDVYVIDATAPGSRAGDLFRLVAELRSGSGTRDAMQIVILPPGAPDLAAMALDLGADDLVSSAVSPGELAERIRRLIGDKAQADRARAALRNGIEAALTDPLTGLRNRRYALPQLAKMREAVRATGRPLALMVLDVDHFKRINDRFGHSSGDAVLTEIARRLQRELRQTDLVARIGGEEFMVALPDARAESAMDTAERIRAAVEDRPFLVSPSGSRAPTFQTLQVTMSIGVAVCRGAEDCTQLFERADAALYAAKTAGRNTVNLHQLPAA